MGAPVRQLFLLLTLDLYNHIVQSQETVVRYHIREEQSKDTFIGNVARDSLLYGNVTEDEYSRMRFQILTQGSKHAAYFKIESTTSTLRTASVLDREKLCPKLTLCVLKFNVAVYMQGSDSGQLNFMKIIVIEVTVDDINDNAPEFPQSEIAIPISEGEDKGYVVVTSGATDKDTGQNNSIQGYKLEPATGMFNLTRVENIPGVVELGIKLLFKLDRETKDFYELKIIATDNGFPVRTGTVKVNVTVTDVNDNRPLFTKANYTANVQENVAIGSPVVTLSARDSDIGENGRITYAFSSRVLKSVREVFAVNETTGVISVISEVDYEKSPSYQFIVVVTDHGNPALLSTALVNIEVEDLNDNAPLINVNLLPGGTEISEAAEEGRTVATVFVSDKDKGDNGKVRCEVMGNNFGLEELYQDTYKIVIKTKLDYETEKFHNVTVNCQDHGSPQRQNMTSFFIRVQDINDNGPEFTKPVYETTLEENNGAGVYIIEVLANDKDSGKNGKVSYFLHTDGVKLFTIDPTMGTITANSRFDRETTPTIIFHVNATDEGDPRMTSSAKVVLTLTDVNDNAPLFTPSEFVFRPLENREAGGKVGTLMAVDLDAGINSQFTFGFVAPHPVDFALDSLTGVITCLTKLDRELQTTYNFTVIVTDKGIPKRYSKAKVTVQVIDTNDNIPVITFPNNHNNTVVLPYTAPVGTLVTEVEAYDTDLGDNSKLLYYIDQINPPNSHSLFDMDVHTGHLTINRKMRLYDADTYRLVLSVKDGGTKQLTSFTNLNVIISVSNDTILLPQRDEESGTNIIIVIVIIIVTIVLSTAIVGTICIIRRIDKGHQESHMRQAKLKLEEQNIIASRHLQESMSTDNSSHLSDDHLKKKNKKEVSFSLSDESDSINNSTLTNITTFSTFKSNPSGLSSIDGKILENPKASSSMLTNTFNTDTTQNTYDDKKYDYEDRKYDIGRYYANQNHLHPQGPETIWLHQLKQDEASQIADILKKGDVDANSEMSAESATSDSGRGGSEEDVNSNRGHPHSDNEEPRQMSQSDLKNADFSRQNSGRHSNVLHSNYKKIPGKAAPPSESFYRNISFSDDSVTANTTVDGSKYPSKIHRNSPNKNTNLSTFSQYSNMPYRTHQSDRSDRSGLNEQSSYGLHYSIQDIDDTISESVATRDGDGDSTTTSGSYTINPEDLCNEIDNMFFKNDVIV